MKLVRKRQRKLVRKGPRAAKARPCVEQLETRDLPSIVSILANVAGAPLQSVSLAVSARVSPNDPGFGSQWDLNNTGQSGGTAGADIHATQAWRSTTGSAKTVVAVIDTGVDYNHPDLYQNIWINQAEIPKSRLRNLADVDHDGYISFADLNNPVNQGIGRITDGNHDGRIDAADILAPMVLDSHGNDTGLGGWAHHSTQDGDIAHPDDLIGWNFVTNTNNPFDDNGHGTHVSGTIGAMGNDGVGVTGINWSVSIMALKFLNAGGSGYESNAISALNYSVAHGATISNNSWGGASYDPSMLAAIQNAQAHGDIFVAAAGNNGRNLDTAPSYPASYNLANMVVVAATDRNDRLASFSNYGAGSVSLAAPGVQILSTTPNNTYSWYSGTSMAAPHVTGVLALLESQHPTWSYSQLINRVMSTADPLPGLQAKTKTGGRLDAAAALADSTPPPAPTKPAPAKPAPASPQATFIEHLYEDVLQRTGSASEINGWVAVLNAGVSRARVAQYFWESAVHRFREVDFYFQHYLHRTLNRTEEWGWVQAFLHGASEADVIREMLVSDEYTVFHPTTASFVDGLYRDLLGRAGEPAGLAYWAGILAATGKRSAVVDGFLHSPELAWRTVDADYRRYLHRSGGTGEEQRAVALMTQERLSFETEAIALLASDEYYRRR